MDLCKHGQQYPCQKCLYPPAEENAAYIHKLNPLPIQTIPYELCDDKYNNLVKFIRTIFLLPDDKSLTIEQHLVIINNELIELRTKNNK